MILIKIKQEKWKCGKMNEKYVWENKIMSDSDKLNDNWNEMKSNQIKLN